MFLKVLLICVHAQLEPVTHAGRGGKVSCATLQMPLTISKPGEKGDVPVGVIAGSVIAGLLLLALAVGLLWKVNAHFSSAGTSWVTLVSTDTSSYTFYINHSQFSFVVRLFQEEVPAAPEGGRR